VSEKSGQAMRMYSPLAALAKIVLNNSLAKREEVNSKKSLRA
jgi:hypothetical protein